MTILDRALSVYFLANFNAGVVKIGTAIDLKSRLASVQTGNHDQLDLIYHFRGCRRCEKKLHRHFAKQRVRGEWFEYTQAIDDLIEDIEQYRDHWAGEALPEEYQMHADEVQFVLDTVDAPWACKTPA